MKMVCESEQLEDYLLELDEVNYSSSIVRDKIEELFTPTQTEIEKAKIARFLLICGIGLAIFRKNEKIKNGLEKIILMPISYLFAHLTIKGLHSTTYLARRDFFAILLVTISLYVALLAGRTY